MQIGLRILLVAQIGNATKYQHLARLVRDLNLHFPTPQLVIFSHIPAAGYGRRSKTE